MIKKAGISNTRVTETINGCEKNGWVLTFEQGENGKQERYIFLNDPLNQCIVQGLKKGCFAITDLEYLNLAGINKLLEKHKLLPTPPETGEEQMFPPPETGEEQMFPPPETGEVPPPETGEVPPPETGEVDKVANQEGQRDSQSLKTNSKNKFKNKQTNGDCLFDKKVEQEATEFLNYALQNKMNVQSAQATKKRYLDARGKGIGHEILMNGLKEAYQRHKQATSPVSVIQIVIGNHIAAEEAKKVAEAEATEREKRHQETKDLARKAMIMAGIDPDTYAGAL
ncbi:proline-rich domain-containing protein [Laceyella sacchari]|uniref:proline-rich domain-containing protein n=1 Tax=Laceyella sacchari TaxID=37482 RepID=UPI0013049AFB|nr:hypothetical protein [Laceyella sacchari]